MLWIRQLRSWEKEKEESLGAEICNVRLNASIDAVT